MTTADFEIDPGELLRVLDRGIEQSNLEDMAPQLCLVALERRGLCVMAVPAITQAAMAGLNLVDLVEQTAEIAERDAALLVVVRPAGFYGLLATFNGWEPRRRRGETVDQFQARIAFEPPTREQSAADLRMVRVLHLVGPGGKQSLLRHACDSDDMEFTPDGDLSRRGPMVRAMGRLYAALSR